MQMPVSAPSTPSRPLGHILGCHSLRVTARLPASTGDSRSARRGGANRDPGGCAHLELGFGDLAAVVQVERGANACHALEQLILQAPYACGAAPPAAATRPASHSASGSPSASASQPAERSRDLARPGPARPRPLGARGGTALRRASPESRGLAYFRRVWTPSLVSRLGRQATPRTPVVLPNRLGPLFGTCTPSKQEPLSRGKI